MTVECRVEERDLQRVLSIRERIPASDLPAKLGEAYGKIMNHIVSVDVTPAGAPFVGYYNMDMTDLDVEIGIPVDGLAQGTDTIHNSQVPAGSYLIAIHTGPYDQLQRTYAAMTEYMNSQQLEGTGVAYEFYLNDPSEVSPHDLMTEIRLQLK